MSAMLDFTRWSNEASETGAAAFQGVAETLLLWRLTVVFPFRRLVFVLIPRSRINLATRFLLQCTPSSFNSA